MTWDEQARPWFECPACGRRCKHLYLDALACRVCCRLDYASRHLHRQVPGVHRVMRWRRMIGIDPHPFAAIPKRPRYHIRAFIASLRRSAPKKASWSGKLPATLSAARGFRGMLPEMNDDTIIQQRVSGRSASSNRQRL